MASISKQANGRKTIQFVAPDGKRKSIRLGKASQKTAQAVKVKIEHLVAAKITGHAIDDETAKWVSELEEVLSDKLAAVGLIQSRERATLEDFIDDYIESRIDTKPRTVQLYEQTKKNLVEFFGPEKLLREITEGDADDWRLHLLSKGLAENTIRRRCGRAKQFLEAAVKKELVNRNPFKELVSNVRANRERFFLITREMSEKVLEACPGHEWRLIFALSRYGGFRCPSEHLALRWGDIDWEHNRIRVTSPKTEHHSGGESRIIPLFPELRPLLEESFDLAPEGQEFVITRYRDTNVNLRTQLIRIIKKAGLEPWPKLFQNLRSSRETELAEEFPMHVVCRWIGNSQPVAAEHYLQVTDEHFLKASKSGAESGAVAVQNAVQQPAARNCTELPRKQKTPGKPDFLLSNSSACNSVQNSQAPRHGLEP